MNTSIRILLAKPTQDCHDRGVRLLARQFRDAGFEVIFINFLLIAEVVSVAVDEDVDVVGISSSTGGHLPIFEDLLSGLKLAGRDDVVVIGGGIIPGVDVQLLKSWGVAEIFGAGSSPANTIGFVRELVRDLPGRSAGVAR